MASTSNNQESDISLDLTTESVSENIETDAKKKDETTAVEVRSDATDSAIKSQNLENSNSELHQGRDDSVKDEKSEENIKFEQGLNSPNGKNTLKEQSSIIDEKKGKPSEDMKVSPEVSILDDDVVESDQLQKNVIRKRNKSTNRKSLNKRLSTLSLKSLTESIHEKASVFQDFIQALGVRLLLFIHSVLCIWRAADVKKDDIYWLLSFSNIILGIEALYTCIFRKGKDPKWICPCFVLYLLGTIPAIWLLQLDMLDRKFNANITTSNSTSEELSSFYGVKLIPISLDAETWASILQQLLLFVLVIGRMLLPRGHLTRDELSQTLFIFIGSGSDVMEFFVVFEDPVFYTNTGLKYATLIIWSISLLQFVFVIAVAKGPKRFRLGTMVDEAGSDHKNFGAELWGLLISISFMDGPYFGLRVYAITAHKVLSYGILFFTCKNMLMLILLFYRLFIVGMKIRSSRKTETPKGLIF